uniref:calponin homology domain-containing protein DDB_G0272472-like n=1 Tax=Semicossyphus pulcher TaxID=241346 RepID=UPI0037E7EFD9
MQQPRNQKRNRRLFRQQAAGGAQQHIPGELETLRRDVRQLTELLERERAHCRREKDQRLLISNELEDVKQQLVKQKTLKEMYINRGKDTKRDLERLEKYSKEETLSVTKIATMVRDTTRQKKKKHLHADYEELQVAHLVSTERFTAELQGEREQIEVLQKELEKTEVSNHELSLRYETDVLSSRQLVETLKFELQQQVEAHAERVSQDQHVIKTLRAEQDALRQTMAEEIHNLQQTSFEKEKQFWTELEELRTQLCVHKLIEKDYEELQSAHKICQERFSAELQEEKNNTKLLQEQLESLRVSKQQLSQRYQTDVLAVRQQAESHQRELETQIKSLMNKEADDQVLIWNLEAEKGVIQQQMAEEINTLQQNIVVKETNYCGELEELKTALSIQLARNMQLQNELQANREDNQPPKRKRSRCEEPEEDQQCMETSSCASAATSGTQPQPVEEEARVSAEQPQEGTPKQPSLWKQARHFLGLRKPESWKKK